MTRAEEVALVARYREGDEEAAVALVARHRPWIVQQAERRLDGDRERAEDVAQAVLLRLLIGGRYDGRSALRTWLYRLVANECANVYRRREVKHEVTLDPEEWARHLHRSASHPSPEDVVAEQMAVEAFLARLPPTEREIVRRCYAKGERVVDVALALGLTRSQVIHRLSDARHRLGGRPGRGARRY